MLKTLVAVFGFAALMPAFGQDKSDDILLVHAATVEIGDYGCSCPQK